jgi:serine/threonine kinase 16
MLGLKIEDKRQTCYMLLPYMPHSLRAEVDSRLFSQERKMRDASYASSPWDEKLVLELFYHLLHGVEAMHDIGYSHRDLKLDNILLHGFDESCLKRPVLSDFGSAGPVSRPCATRKDIFEIAEEASQCTTMSYRPPELFPGALMVGHEPLNYCLVDCWSLGCTLFAILFGASPFECTFLRETGALRIGDCNQLSVLADLPRPNPETPRGKWYSEDMWDLLEFILETDRTKRPSLAMIQSRVSSLLTKETMPDEIPAIEEVTSVEDFP